MIYLGPEEQLVIALISVIISLTGLALSIVNWIRTKDND